MMNTIYKICTAISVILLTIFACSENGGTASDIGSVGEGRGGSMARFTIYGNHIYTVDFSTLRTFDLSTPEQPKYLDRKDQLLSFGIETIFAMDTVLFLGSQDGMYLYNVARPEFPQLMSHVYHIRSCDPIVVSGKHAYVTLNTQNTWCGSNSNVLQIYDISDIRNPVLKLTENVNYPKGLGVDGNKLFVCDEIQGIKVYDITNPLNPIWIDDLAHIPETKGAKFYDVIPAGGVLIASADKGIFQFDYSGENLLFLSKITTVNR